MAKNPDLESYEIHLAEADALALARCGRLGCDCAAGGLPMPCAHVLDAARDPVLREMMRRMVAGEEDALALAAAVESIEADAVRFAPYQGSYRPERPARIRFDKEERMRLFRERIKAGQSCDHPADFFNEVDDDDGD